MVLAALVFSLPVFLLAMVFSYIPHVKEGLNTNVGGFTVNEIVQWILTTPVQVRHVLQSTDVLSIILCTSFRYTQSCHACLYAAFSHRQALQCLLHATASLLMFFQVLSNVKAASHYAGGQPW